MFKKILVSAASDGRHRGFAADLPSVKILATGGTIAGTAASSTQTTGYKAGDLGIQTFDRSRSGNERLCQCFRRTGRQDLFQQHGHKDLAETGQAR